LQILEWLKKSAKTFSAQTDGESRQRRRLRAADRAKAARQPPTASEHLKVLAQTGLIATNASNSGVLQKEGSGNSRLEALVTR